MTSHWQPVTLGDLVDIKHGFAFKGEYITENETGDFLLTPGNFAIGGGFQWGKKKFYAGPVSDEYVLRAGDIIVTMTDLSKEADTLGYAARVPSVEKRLLHNQRLGKLVFRSNSLKPSFAHWLLRTREYRNEVLANYTGSTVKHTSPSKIRAFEFLLPPDDEQDAIAGMLDALDDKIELNRRMSATLEEMARALYRSWFVDFDPVHARALGHPPAHMDATTAALFPDSFGPDGLPKGWEREPLSQHVKATRGLSYKGKHLCGAGDGAPLHNLNSIYEGGGYKDEGAKFYDGEFKPRHEIRPGDLIVANTEQSFGLELIGHAALVPSWLGPSGIFSQHLYKIAIRGGSPLSKEWLYLALSIAPLGMEIRGFSNGTTVNMLPADAFEIPETAIPPAAIVEKMNEIVRPAFAQQERLREESRTLAALRDALLPRLMSGELRVREAEKKVEQVL
jgi:type I restriction enzyme S subunit